MSSAIVQYTASDGSSVKLSPQIVTKYIVTGGEPVPDREVFAFLAKCQARRLNPLAGDAYMTMFKGKASVIVSKDYFVRTATQQPGFDGIKAGVVVVGGDGSLAYREGAMVLPGETLVGGWAEVWDKGRRMPSHAEVSLGEYDQKRSLWLSKPATMIRKVALVQALREAYPGAYGGIYDADEMPAPDVADVPEPEVVVPAAVEVQPVVVAEDGAAEMEAARQEQPGYWEENF